MHLLNGRRIPFVSSILLVAVGLVCSLNFTRKPRICGSRAKGKKLNAPVGSVVFTKHLKPMIIGTFIMVATYSLFYIMTAFAQACLSNSAKAF